MPIFSEPNIMTFRIPTLAALALMGLAAEQASAQPIAPPRRPVFSGYSSLLYPGGGYYGYGFGGPGGYGGYGAPGYGSFGYGGYGPYAGYGGLGFGGIGGLGFGGIRGGVAGLGLNGAVQAQNMMLAQQLAQTNQNINNLTQFLATGVNPNFPVTGHPAMFNYLGHWYPTLSGGGMGGGMGMVGGAMMGGGGMQRTAGAGYTPPGGGAGGGAGGNNAPRTAGTGIPVGGARK